jgi:hypothetical protein
MPLSCNIDAKGKAVRLIYGVILLAGGIALGLFWARGSESPFRWIVSMALGAAGAFAIFESRKGWCALRAMGFKTSI